MEKLIPILDDSTLLTLLKYNLLSTSPEAIKIAQDLSAQSPSKIQDSNIRDKFLKLKQQAEDEVSSLKSSLSKCMSSLQTGLSPKKPIVIYIDGVFDIIHSGHFNALRQAKKLGDILYLGINSDEDVCKVKGPTMMNCTERSLLGEACKWVDKVIPNTPYTPSLKLLDEIHADFSAHGDDICVDQNGKCVYDEIIDAGRMKYFKRTEGVSTTEIMGRLLSNCLDSNNEEDKKYINFQKTKKPLLSSFLATSNRISLFSNKRTPGPNDKVVYLSGSFDLLHVGLIDILKKAKELGDFLYVGVYDDDLSHRIMGKNYPILNLNERVFNLLALKYVDEVILGCPYKVTEDMIRLLKINTVVFWGENENEYMEEKRCVDCKKLKEEFGDQYEVPKKMGIFKLIKSDYLLNNDIFIERLKKHKDLYLKKYLKKSAQDENPEKNLVTNVQEI